LSQTDRLRRLLRQLQRAQLGRRSEKLDPEQLHLAIADIEQAVAAGSGSGARRGALPFIILVFHEIRNHIRRGLSGCFFSSR
jgi:hypothetical protein